jgi:hypothetical protein
MPRLYDHANSYLANASRQGNASTRCSYCDPDSNPDRFGDADPDADTCVGHVSDSGCGRLGSNRNADQPSHGIALRRVYSDALADSADNSTQADAPRGYTDRKPGRSNDVRCYTYSIASCASGDWRGSKRNWRPQLVASLWPAHGGVVDHCNRLAWSSP